MDLRQDDHQIQSDGVAKAERLLAQLERDRQAMRESVGAAKYDRAIAAVTAVLNALRTSQES